MALGNEQRWEVLPLSPQVFREVTAQCTGGRASRMLKTFEEGSLQEQQAALTDFLRSCRQVADMANMYLCDCGTFLVRFFVLAERRALLVLTVEAPNPPDEPEQTQPPRPH
jgi:hypothetical protein